MPMDLDDCRPATAGEAREFLLSRVPKEHRDALRAYEEAIAERMNAEANEKSLRYQLAEAERKSADALGAEQVAWDKLKALRVEHAGVS